MPFILTSANNYDTNGLPIDAMDVLRDRLLNNKWPIYAGTRNRLKLLSGERVLFYVSSKAVGYKIVANAEIFVARPPNLKDYCISNPSPVHSILSFKNIKFLKKNIDFKKKLPKLSFAPKNMTKWGVVVLGGCRYVSLTDYMLIMSK